MCSGYDVRAFAKSTGCFPPTPKLKVEVEKAAWRVCNAYFGGPETVTDWGLRLNQAIEALHVALKGEPLKAEEQADG